MSEGAARRAAAIRTRFARQPYVRRDRLHKFAIGEVVALSSSPGVVRTKDMERELIAARFEIMRLLPEQDRSLQYRVKDTISGQERVVAEESILSNLE
jgi:hypothetical protein